METLSETGIMKRLSRQTEEALNLTQEEIGRRVSETLDILFSHGYNKQLRPGIGHRPTQVEVNIAIRKMQDDSLNS